MQTKAYKRSILREIVSSKARFFSILIIIMLGVTFYTGIKSAGPDMDQSINNYYISQNLMDSKIVSTLGLTDKDLELLRDNDEILDFYGTHSIDANLTNINNVVRFMEYNSKNNINEFITLEGRLPEQRGEIALDERAFILNKDLKVGDEFTIKSDEDTMESFNKTTFKIVGIVKSPMYIETSGRGTTTVGKGTIDYFAVLNSSDIAMDVYTEIYVRFRNVQGLQGYSDEYKDLMKKNNEYIKELYSQRSLDRVEEIKADIQKELDKGYKEIEENEQKLLDAEKDLQDGRWQLEDGKQQYGQGVKDFENSIKEGEANLVAGEKQLQQGQKEIDKQKEAINAGQIQLDQAKNELDKAKEEFSNEGINPDEGTVALENSIKDLNTLASTLSELSEDIRNTVSNINNEEIPYEKIQGWKAIIIALGLSDLSSLIGELENDPKNIGIAISIVDSLDATVKNTKENASKLEILVSGVATYQAGKAKYDEQLTIFNVGKAQIEEAQKQLDIGKAEIAKGKKELEQGEMQGKEELEAVRIQLAESEQQIIDGEKEIEENKQKIEDAKNEIATEEKNAYKNIDKAKYFFFDRTDNPGYSGYNDAIVTLDNIASVLPVFFFLVAVLICLTTMTRMVEENRVEIGTLKALGYGDLHISCKYVVYAAIASICGSLLGILVGSNLLPMVISDAYGSLYSLPKLNIYYYPSFIIQSMVISILCTVGASLFVINVELKSKPSNLMRPKAPKLGKKILLERITPLWKRLSFNYKVTFRNIFRYKQRMIMTVLGIAGCMALLITGFGLNDSNIGAVHRQFNKLWKYEAMVVFDGNSTDEDYIKYNDTLNSLYGYEENLNIHQETVTFSKENMNKQSAYLYVPQYKDKLNEFILLNDRVSEEQYELSDNGVIINEKLAKLLGVKVGEMITLEDELNNPYEVKVNNIVENYLMHYVYMSPAYYEKIFDEKPGYNIQLLKFNSSEADDVISSKLLACDNVINVTLTSEIKKSTEESTENMNLVMLVIIVASGCLAFVVLYNLNNINVSERIRELSTIKVLGFFDDEVTMYIFRENIILTLLGVITGSFLGKILHTFIIYTAETDTMMMYPNISMKSYIYSALLTILFSLIVMIMMHVKLKNVNMIDALKSNE